MQESWKLKLVKIYKTIFLTTTPEQRDKQRYLVNSLKSRITEEPNKNTSFKIVPFLVLIRLLYELTCVVSG